MKGQTHPQFLFDNRSETYDAWFSTPLGRLVFETEAALIQELLEPRSGENIFDGGCGTGIFTLEFLKHGARVIGLDVSYPMLARACLKTSGRPFQAIQGNMLALPFQNNYFDKSVSVTAIEFIADARTAVEELFRVTRPGGTVVVATLNSLSPWATRRKAKKEDHVLTDAFFRSPAELLALNGRKGSVKTVVHFKKDDDIDLARQIENAGQQGQCETGAFIAAKWTK